MARLIEAKKCTCGNGWWTIWDIYRPGHFLLERDAIPAWALARIARGGIA